jgi:peptidoglycan L-alanyl-D-glutamate endopeptidase CwlK
MHKFSTRSRQRLAGVDPLLIAIMVYGISDSPHDFGIPEDGGLRTAERQAELFAQGRTKPGAIITQVDGVRKRSRHQPAADGMGKAVDIFAFVDGKASWDAKYYEPIARHLQKVAMAIFNVELEWGGDWPNFKDLPHFQIKG